MAYIKVIYILHYINCLLEQRMPTVKNWHLVQFTETNMIILSEIYYKIN